ncbi:hypothetical protein NEOC95_002357 [Neochlamydia sp. AcF95]|nr:hypothetical protein [Neochlamydia sp. AcF95]
MLIKDEESKLFILPSKANQAASEVRQQLIVYTHRGRDYANL